MLLEFANVMELVVLNTWFMKNESKKVTYESRGNKSVVDYMLVRRCDLAKVSDINVIGSEECVQQHKLLICKIDLQESVKKRKEKFVRRHKVWRVGENKKKKKIFEKGEEREGRREKGGLEAIWR